MATYLITQASGSQSRWTIDYLLQAGAKVHGLVRDLEKAPEFLKRDGITLFQGESVDPDAVFAAAKGCKGVFLNTYPVPEGLEERQTKGILEGCKKANVTSIVASTSVGTGNREVWGTDECKPLHPYYESKSTIERLVRESGLTYTILRPAFMHGNYYHPMSQGNFPTLHQTGCLNHTCNPDARMPMTDIADVGKYAAAALLNPAKFSGQEISVTSENLTMEEQRDAVAAASGKEITLKRLTEEEIKSGEFFVQPFHLFLINYKNLDFLVEEARVASEKYGIPLTGLKDALVRDRDLLIKCLPA